MKRFISLAICAIMLITAVAAMPVAAWQGGDSWYPYEDWDQIVVDTYELGDIDGNSELNALDALALRSYVAGNEVDGFVEDAADIIDFNNINAKDLLVLRRALGNLVNISDYETDNAVQSFTIAGNDISTFSLVVPTGSSTMDYVGNAADQFRRLVRMATGYNLSIASTKTAAHAVYFHGVDEESPEGQMLEVENFIYEVVDGDLHIYGTRRGNLHAVWTILEEYLGFRFYSNRYGFQYEARTVDIPEGTYVYKHPVMDLRHCSQDFGLTNAPYHYYARRLNGTQVGAWAEPRWGTQTGPMYDNAHSYGTYWRMATGEYEGAGIENPGLYGKKLETGYRQDELNWNPCMTSDLHYGILFRGLLETIRYAMSWKTFYSTSVMSFSICDSSYLCSCSQCGMIMDEGENIFTGEKKLGAGGAGLCIYFANRACRDIQKYTITRPASMENDYGFGEAITDEYPGLRLYTILYDYSKPVPEVLPEDNLIIMYCSVPCNAHYLGSEECRNQTLLGKDGLFASESMKAWGAACKQTGAEMWFWYYPVTYGSYICDAPNITNIYHDVKYLVEECNVTGMYYEGGGPGYQFEPLKANMAAIVMYSVEYDANGNVTMMSEEEFHAAMKDYLHLFYGDGYEKVYEYLLMYEASSDAIDDEEGRSVYCYTNNHDRPGDQFSYYYWQENYIEMRQLLVDALALTEAEDAELKSMHIQRIKYLLMGCDTLGLSACCKMWQAAGDTEMMDFYVETYTELYNFIKSNNITTFAGGECPIPETLDLSIDPLHAFNDIPSWNMTDCDATWGASENMPDWGFHG